MFSASIQNIFKHTYIHKNILTVWVHTKYGLSQDLMWTDAEWSIAKFYGMLSMCAIMYFWMQDKISTNENWLHNIDVA